MEILTFENSHFWKELKIIKEVGTLFEIDNQGRMWKIAQKRGGVGVVGMDKRWTKHCFG